MRIKGHDHERAEHEAQREDGRERADDAGHDRHRDAQHGEAREDHEPGWARACLATGAEARRGRGARVARVAAGQVHEEAFEIAAGDRGVGEPDALFELVVGEPALTRAFSRRKSTTRSRSASEARSSEKRSAATTT